MIRNPKELTSAQLMIALVAILCELSDRMPIWTFCRHPLQPLPTSTLRFLLAHQMQVLRKSQVLMQQVQIQPRHMLPVKQVDLSVLFDADGDTATTGHTPFQFSDGCDWCKRAQWTSSLIPNCR